MGNIVDFVVEASKNPEKGKALSDLLKQKDITAEGLMEWFKKENHDVPLDDCKKIIENKELIAEGASVKSY